ncbi:TPA: hypothetical protein NGT22_004518 [Vibrio parahaemolyticus]|nr:hypothetical protein [Vibrio parahaemolyticus]
MFGIFKKKEKKEADWILLNSDNSKFNFSGVCKAYYKGNHVIDLAQYEKQGQTFFIKHFVSVLDEQLEVKYKGMGEPFLRCLAQEVALKYPDVTEIEIELHSTITQVKECPERLEKVKNARENLLKKIGIDNVVVKPVPERKCFEVKGTWIRNDW